ncbi:MAG: radical SAM protein [Promethearchaeota archaeon]
MLRDRYKGPDLNLLVLPAETILIRPPIESNSILIAVTGGCSWNKCRFCGVYKGVQDYHLRKLEEILADIQYFAQIHPNHPHLFLAGGNAFSTPTDYLLQILHHITQNFPYIQRISVYAKILDIVNKSDDELKQLAEAGLSICYIGLESGSNILLKYMKKGQTAQMVINTIPRLMKAGIKASLYIILGLGGKKWTEIHATQTARVLNATNPTVFRFRTLNIMERAPLRRDVEDSEFIMLTPLEILQEERSIIAQLNPTLTSALRNDHVSNYSFVRSDNIGQDQQLVLGKLDSLINDPKTALWRSKNLKQM